MYNEQQIQAYLNRLHYNKEITLTREVLDERRISNPPLQVCGALSGG